jgi:hypothetical protein
LDSFDERARELALENDKGGRVPRESVELGRMVKLAAILAEIFRGKYKERKVKSKEAFLNARRLLDKLDEKYGPLVKHDKESC